MKRILAVVMMAMWVGACNESTTGVKSSSHSGGDDGFIPPDTVIKQEGITTEAYGPGHPWTIAREAELVARDDASAEVTRLETDSYSFAAGNSFAYNLKFPDGSAATLTILHLDGEEDGFSQVILLRVGERELLRTVRVGDRFPGGFAFETPAKIDTQPQSMLGWGWLLCLVRAYMDAVACMRECPPVNSMACFFDCLNMTMSNFANCLWMTE